MHKWLLVLACLVFLTLLVRRTSSMEPLDSTPEPPYRMMLPHVVRHPTPKPSPTPEPTPAPEVLLYDADGQLADAAWLSDTFGAVIWQPQAGVRLVALRWATADASLRVSVQDESGRPVENVTVVRYWPDAPPLPPPLIWDATYNRGVYGPTNAQGIIEFVMGSGDKYWPTEQVGASAIWVGGPASYLIAGLGMVNGTNHDHLNSEWTLSTAEARALQAECWGFTPGAGVRYEGSGNGEPVPIVSWPGD